MKGQSPGEGEVGADPQNLLDKRSGLRYGIFCEKTEEIKPMRKRSTDGDRIRREPWQLGAWREGRREWASEAGLNADPRVLSVGSGGQYPRYPT